jgi:hypothetical protein
MLQCNIACCNTVKQAYAPRWESEEEKTFLIKGTKNAANSDTGLFDQSFIR